MTQDELKSLFWYHPEFGVFYWRQELRNGAIKPFDMAGCKDKDGYTQIKLKGRVYRAHKLAWLYMYGETPRMVDHINGDRSDNRIANLRLASVKQNNENTTLRRDNKTGCRGVSFSQREGKYVARVEHNGKKILIGYFDDLAKAADQVQAARSAIYTHDVGRAKLREKNGGGV